MKSIYLLPGGFNSFVSYTFVYLFFLFYAFFVVFSPFYPLYALILMIPLPYLNDIEIRPLVMLLPLLLCVRYYSAISYPAASSAASAFS